MWVASLIPYDGFTVESFHSNYQSAWNAIGCIIDNQFSNCEWKQKLITLYNSLQSEALSEEVYRGSHGHLNIYEVEIFDSHPTPNFN